MNDLTAKSKSPKAIAFILIELAVLLILPLPFLKLNALYVASALVIMLLSKYLRKEKWSDYGFKPIKLKWLFIAIAIGLVFGFVDTYFIGPLITKLNGIKPDLSSYEAIKGNIGRLIAALAIGWIIGGLFEEFFFRGYIYNRLESIIHRPLLFKWVSIILTSIVFAFAHNYQGISGIIDTGLFAVIMGLLYFAFGRNIWYLIIIHGLYDTVGFFQLFLSQ